METISYADSQLVNAMIGHLKNQFQTATPVLFTGAGFSIGATNTLGRQIPTVESLRRSLWGICFGNEPFEPSNSLQDLFQLAKNQHKKALIDFMTHEFNVNSATLPDWYQKILSLPWHRIYTLNIDNLETSADKAYHLPRSVRVTSATSQYELGIVNERKYLHVVHLNGSLNDIPDNVTFTFRQYAERLAREEPWFGQLTSDILSRPIVFIGTELDEPPLWQYIEKRKSRGGKELKELRPKSYLIVPSISRARRSSLSDYNISHIPLTGQAFTNSIISQLSESAERGHAFLRTFEDDDRSKTILDEVSNLATHPDEQTDYLFGSEPKWSDIQSGRAALRSIDQDIENTVKAARQLPRSKGIIIISGTAGTGKSTSLQRVALSLSSSGVRVAWADLSDGDISPHTVRQSMHGRNAPEVLAIDDADLYGNELTSLLRDICTSDNYPLIILALRSGKIDKVINSTQLSKIPTTELVMPTLTEEDIDSLLDILTREKRLGILRELTRSQQKSIFREKCGRQLLVAMIEATSGQTFHEKIRGEFSELDGDMQRIYAITSTASAFRYYLNKSDLLLAINGPNNETLNSMDKLVRRMLIHCENGVRFYARHPYIASVVFTQLVEEGEASQVIADIIRSAALQVNPEDSQSTRHRRIMRSFTNHEFLLTSIGSQDASLMYGELESLLSRDHNYWLQRGSLAVEDGNLFHAENFLGQARALNPRDMNVQTEYAYLLFRKAISNPSGTDSKRYIEEAESLLRSNIVNRGDKDPHSYHVLGSNMLEWIEKGIPDYSERKTTIETLISEIDEGITKHPGNLHLKALKDKLHHAYLLMAVR